MTINENDYVSAKFSDGTQRRLFRSGPSDKYKEAVRVLQALLEEEGSDSVQRAFASVVWAERRNAYFASHKMEPKASGGGCVHKLMGKERCSSSGNCQQVPVSEKCEWGMQDGKRVLLISQPYELNTDELRELVKFCDQHEVKVIIRAWESWHFPGATITVAYQRKRDSEDTTNKQEMEGK